MGAKSQRYAIGTAVTLPRLTTGKPALVGKITLYYGNGQYLITWKQAGTEEWSEREIRAMLIIGKAEGR